MKRMTSKRQENFELLRIVAMLMIITMHYLGKGNVIVSYIENDTPVNYFGWLIESFCIVAVNCYVLLSGYFLVESEWRLGRIVSLLCQILFYSLLIPVVMLGTGAVAWEDLGVYDWICFFLPIEAEHYWFATAYLLMYLFAPLLAAGVKKTDRKTLRLIILALLFFLSVEKTIFPVAFATDRYGYEYGWFLFLFLIAAYIRLYGCPFLEKKRNAVLVYLGMSLLIMAVSAGAGQIAKRTGSAAFTYYMDMPYSYNYLFCLLGAVGFFYAFKNWKMKEGRAANLIRRLSPYTFGIYLLHEHSLIRYQWMKWLGVDNVRGRWMFLPHMIGCVLAVYLVGTLIDYVRAYLFAGIEKLHEERKARRK